jgi:hypothetical protein
VKVKTNVKLKPCPWCGEIPVWDGYEPRNHEYVCKKCDLWGIQPRWWNKRILYTEAEVRERERKAYVAGCRDESNWQGSIPALAEFQNQAERRYPCK